ncbi:hypothetical protein FRB99_007568 [Tulasnella sp. 403]|nr:hypothetical protein FRB99_007568 [Tulasnella sp. 403]
MSANASSPCTDGRMPSAPQCTESVVEADNTTQAMDELYRLVITTLPTNQPIIIRCNLPTWQSEESLASFGVDLYDLRALHAKSLVFVHAFTDKLKAAGFQASYKLTISAATPCTLLRVTSGDPYTALPQSELDKTCATLKEKLATVAQREVLSSLTRPLAYARSHALTTEFPATSFPFLCDDATGISDTIESAFPFSLPVWFTSYHQEVTPLSTWPSVATAIAVYLGTIFGLREIMRDRAPLKLNTLFQLHNLILTTGSGLLLAVMLEEIVPIVWNNGLFYGICGYGAWTPRLEFFYIINYYFKYLELIDTVFLALKKKPLAFLHVFHHSATALLCFTQLNGRTSVSWVPIVLNLTVHVFMYYYYWATAGGRKIWWKKYLTSMQITQFIIDLFVVYFATYAYFSSTYFPGRYPSPGNCAGEEHAAIFGCGLLTSYLFLFIDFYIRTYKGGAKRGSKPIASKDADKVKANGVANGHANGSAKPNGLAQH